MIGIFSNANHATFPFRCVHITDIGIGYISTMLALHTLYLRWCTQIRDFGLQHICGMRSMQILSLAGTCQTVQNSYYQDSHSCFHVKKEFMNSLKLIKRMYAFCTNILKTNAYLLLGFVTFFLLIMRTIQNSFHIEKLGGTHYKN